MIVVVTGANRGIGLEFAKLYKSKGHTVIGTTRNPTTTALQGIADKVLTLDVGDESSIHAFAESLSSTTIDLLINNAGILIQDDLSTAKSGDILDQFRVNALGPFLVTRQVSSLLAKNAKVVNITSRMGSIEDNTSGAYYGYRASKTALNMFTKSLSLDLKGPLVFALHPGFIKTDMTGGRGEMGAEEAVSLMAKVIEQVKEPGGFWHRDGYKLPY